MARLFNFFNRYKAEDPLRLVANARQQNRIANILEDIQGVNCTIQKPTNKEGVGWRIVVGTGSDIDTPEGFPKLANGSGHFLVVQDTATAVKVSGGWWAYYDDYNGRVQVDLDNGAGGTITSYDDLTTSISLSGAGIVYLELDISADTLTAAFAASLPSDSENVFHKKIATIVSSDGQYIVKQAWRGGNILTIHGPTLDGLSLDRDGAGDDEKVQIYNWDNAADGGVLGPDFLLLNRASGAARYTTVDTLTGYVANYVNDNFDGWGSLPVDNDSINWNSSITEIQLYNWDTATGTTSGLVSNSLFPFKSYSGGAYVSNLKYVTLASLAAAIDGELGTAYHTDQDFSDASTGWAALGTGKSGGNTDHDDSYWHAYNDGSGLLGHDSFTDTKTYKTSGNLEAANVWFDALTINSIAALNVWSSSNFFVEVTGPAEIVSTASTARIGGLSSTTVDSGGAVNLAPSGDLQINGTAGTTGDGFTKGIKTDDAAFDSHITDIVEMYL